MCDKHTFLLISISLSLSSLYKSNKPSLLSLHVFKNTMVFFLLQISARGKWVPATVGRPGTAAPPLRNPNYIFSYFFSLFSSTPTSSLFFLKKIQRATTLILDQKKKERKLPFLLSFWFGLASIRTGFWNLTSFIGLLLNSTAACCVCSCVFESQDFVCCDNDWCCWCVTLSVGFMIRRFGLCYGCAMLDS